MAPTFFSSGIADPFPTPPRPDEGVRRTTHVDIVPAADRGLVLRSRCRDLLDGTDPRVVGDAEVVAALDSTQHLVSLQHPGDVELPLTGRLVGAGFRATLEALTPQGQAGAPLFVLLDELPVATVISGYARMYEHDSAEMSGAADHMGDICSGWRTDGLMIRSIRSTGRMPVPLGPVAPSPEHTDPWAWHEMAALRPGEMRRRRLIDLGPDGSVFATFRDTHVEPDGTERVLHEYTLTAGLEGGRFTRCVAAPRVLPWHECPDAAASAARLDGIEPREVHRAMKGSRGLGTCTHLNDLLRSLAGLDHLAAMVGR
jgi:Protein of unknown function (DUF2889)